MKDLNQMTQRERHKYLQELQNNKEVEEFTEQALFSAIDHLRQYRDDKEISLFVKTSKAEDGQEAEAIGSLREYVLWREASDSLDMKRQSLRRNKSTRWNLSHPWSKP